MLQVRTNVSQGTYLNFVDITDRKRTEEALQRAQAELAHVNRVAVLGELSTSIANEISQPLTAIETNANAGLRWLALDPPNTTEAREAIRRIIRHSRSYLLI